MGVNLKSQSEASSAKTRQRCLERRGIYCDTETPNSLGRAVESTIMMRRAVQVLPEIHAMGKTGSPREPTRWLRAWRLAEYNRWPRLLRRSCC
mmetsp:Transcript_34855/g.78205  ORF Transcript_34855/g.78205 Transcript_34855/m.78205 type:complete len:93 (+) Transcript_34855:447-725(+)